MLIPEIKQLLDMLCPQTLAEKHKSVVRIENLDEQAQRNMYEIMQNIIADELPFVVEVEMRKQEKKKT